MRRLLKILLTLLAVTLLALATSPWWLSLPLRPILASNGITYATYGSGGYSKLILTDIRVSTPAADATLARLETDTPLVLLARRLFATPGPITITDCTVTLKPTPANTAPPPSSKPAGILPIRDLVENLRAQIAPWAPALHLANGKIHPAAAGAAPITIANIALTQNAAATKIEITGLSTRGHTAAAALTLTPETTTLRADLDTAGTNLRLTLTGNQLAGMLHTFGQTAALAARFPAAGWLPDEALLEAPSLTLDAAQLARLKLPRHTAATGKLLLQYRDTRLTIDIAAQSEIQNPKSKINLALHAQGTPAQIDITTLDITLPFLAAKLTTPVTITRDLRLLTPESRFTLDADLSKQPWLPDATGRVTGDITLANPGAPATPATLHATARLSAENIRIRDIAITRLTLAATQHDRLTTLTQLDLALPHNTTLAATGAYDAATRTLSKTTLSLRASHAALAPFLPPGITFDTATLDATAEGPAAAPAHTGALAIKQLRAPGLANPADITADWHGHDLAADSLNLALTAAHTRLTLNAANLSPRQATLTALTLSKDNTTCLALAAPATCTRTPEGAITLTPLLLASPDNVSKLSLQATLAPAASEPPAPHSSFHLTLAAANIDSTLLADLAGPGPLPWHITAADITATLPAPGAALAATLNLDARLDYADAIPAAATDTHALPESARIHANATLTEKSLDIAHLTISESPGDSLIAHIAGALPLTIRPSSPAPVTLDKTAPLALDAHTQPGSPFWQNLANATGIILDTPNIHARLEGTLQKPRADARVTINRLHFDQTRWPKRLPKLPQLPPLPPLTDLAATLLTDGNTLDLRQFTLRIAGQPLTATARFTLGENLAPSLETLNLHTDADLSAFAPYSESILAPRGRLQLAVNLAAGQPIDGRLQLADAALRPVAPLGVVNTINLDARLTGRRLDITNATALIGSQPAAITGSVEFPAPGEKKSPFRTRPDLSIKATNIPFVREPGLLVRGDIDLRIQTTNTPAPDTPLIKGAITLRDSLFLADLRSLWGSRPASGPASRPPFFAIDTPPLDTWQLDIDVRGPRFMRIDTTIFTANVTADFKLDGTLGAPRLTGDANIDTGKVLLPFATFTTQTGRVRITKANPHLPTIEFAATSRTLGYDLRMEIRGTLDTPKLTFTSNPALSSEKILLFVMAGEVPSNDYDYSTQQRALALGTYLGQGLVNELFGLSSEEGRLTLTSGEKLTKQGRETYNVEYKLTDRWSAVGEYDEFDAYNLGLKWLAYRSKIPAPPVPGNAEPPPGAPEKEKPAPPKLKLAGRGFWKNLTTKRMLQRTLALDDTHAPSLNANEVEDAAFLLVSQLIADGYSHPKLELTTTPNPKSKIENPKSYATTETLALELPRDLAAGTLRIKVTPGLRYKLRDITFTGRRTITDDDARQFFLPASGLLSDSGIPYSPATLKSCANALQESLQQQGYAEAAVAITDTKIDDATGRVTAAIDINEGPLWQIATLTLKASAGAHADDLETLAPEIKKEFTSKPWSQWTQQDIAERARQHYYRRGHPDVTAQVTPATANSTNPQSANQNPKSYRPVTVEVTITPGPEVRIAEITLNGNRHTRESLIRRRLRVQPGDILNPLALEAARNRISGLGVFRTIDLDYAPPGGDLRTVNINLVEIPQTTINLLLGWGSYEELRGGVELIRSNTIGIADETRLQFIQSMKSTRGDLTFGVPDLFARRINGSVRLFGLRRDEVAFVREEYGGTATLRRAWGSRGYEVSAGYTYEYLSNSDDTLSPDAGETGGTIAAAINLSLSRDKRDNPLSPKRGYNWYLQGEFASHYLGGQANYQRYRLGATYHTNWGRTRWIHAGLSQGFILPIGSKDTPLPVNKLFYPGGENSIRGYKEGDAAPRDANGDYLGAKVYTLLNLELEQALVGSLNLVIFYDLLGESADIADYPGNIWLNSAGLGLRYHTILGPIRLEYGRNLNPRPGDPKGTLQFSVGIPF